MKDYELRYLPLFYEDLEEKLLYIARNLRNPEAAGNLLDKIEAAVLERLSFAEAFEQYHSVRERIYPYYRIYVDNFVVYYVVIGTVMEVRRLLYKGQNAQKKI